MSKPMTVESLVTVAREIQNSMDRDRDWRCLLAEYEFYFSYPYVDDMFQSDKSAEYIVEFCQLWKDMPKELTKNEMRQLVSNILTCHGSEARQDIDRAIFDRLCPHPGRGDVIWDYRKHFDHPPTVDDVMNLIWPAELQVAVNRGDGAKSHEQPESAKNRDERWAELVRACSTPFSPFELMMSNETPSSVLEASLGVLSSRSDCSPDQLQDIVERILALAGTLAELRLLVHEFELNCRHPAKSDLLFHPAVHFAGNGRPSAKEIVDKALYTSEGG